MMNYYFFTLGSKGSLGLKTKKAKNKMSV